MPIKFIKKQSISSAVINDIKSFILESGAITQEELDQLDFVVKNERVYPNGPQEIKNKLPILPV